jgi:hypothetical protein
MMQLLDYQQQMQRLIEGQDAAAGACATLHSHALAQQCTCHMQRQVQQH